MKSLFIIIKFNIFILIILPNTKLFGKSVFEYTTPNRYVNDFANILTSKEVNWLEVKLAIIEQLTSNQITFVSVDSLEGLSPKTFSHKLANQWGVGQSGKDNGVLILVKPKYPNEKGEIYIAIGLGLESKITNEETKLVIDKIILPRFKNNQIYLGLFYGIEHIFHLSAGIEPDYYAKSFSFKDYQTSIISLLIIFIFIPILYPIYLRKRQVPKEFNHYFITGKYNLENILLQIEKIEKRFGKKYSKFKREVQKYDRLSKGNLIEYSNIIDNKIFCYLLNGRNRYTLFWKMSDPFLISIFTFLFLSFSYICVIFYQYNGYKSLIIAIVFSFLIIYILLGVLTSIIYLIYYSLKKKNKHLDGINLGMFTLNTIFKKNIKKKYNPNTKTYSYHLGFAYYASNLQNVDYGYFGSGSGTISSGSYGVGGIGSGGFGGGSFGGGGAGGSW